MAAFFISVALVVILCQIFLLYRKVHGATAVLDEEAARSPKPLDHISLLEEALLPRDGNYPEDWVREAEGQVTEEVPRPPVTIVHSSTLDASKIVSGNVTFHSTSVHRFSEGGWIKPGSRKET